MTSKVSASSLPPGWQRARLGDLAEDDEAFADGPFGSNLKTEHYSSKGARVIRLQNIGRGIFLDADKAFIPLEHFANLRRHGLEPDDVIIAALGDGARPAGRACVLPPGLGPAIVKADCFRIRLPRRLILPEFLAGFLNSPQSLTRVAGLMRGATRPRVTLKILKQLEVVLPSVLEQARIVRALGQAMQAVEQARAAAEVRLAAARTLPPAHLRSLFDRATPGGWHEIPLGKVLTLRKDVIHPRDLPRGRARFVGLEHIESGTGLRTGSLEVELADLTGRKPQFEQGEIVYGYLRPYLNKVWVAEFNGLCSVDQYVFRVDPAHDQHFIAAFMRSASFLRRAPIATTPGQLPRIRTDEVASVSIALPPLLEQRRLLRQLAAADEATVKARRSSEAELAAIKSLAAALPRRAFTGEL